MPDTITSPNMNLPVPVPGADPGPQYATDINSCFALIDTHDHSSGKGVPVTPSGIDITSDLPFGSNNATQLRSARFTAQGAPLAGVLDLDCVYVSGVDLYYNDGNGNQVRITQSGGVAGSPGSIANLTSPASASYVAVDATFVWESDANTAAAMDNGPVTIREILANAKGITIASPVALAADYQLTLPGALPAGTRFLTVDNAGNVGDSYNVDNVTLDITAGLIEVKDHGISNVKLGTLGQQTSVLSSGVFTHTYAGSPAYVDVTNLTVTITSTGRPIMVLVIPDGTSNPNGMNNSQNVGNARLTRGGTNIGQFALQDVFVPTTGVLTVDAQAAGTYTYKMQVNATNTSNSTVQYAKLMAFEL